MPLLALIPTKDWIYCGFIVAILAGGFWYHHKLIDEGIAQQQAADASESTELARKTAEQTAELQIRATTAEQAYDKEYAANQSYRDSRPIEPIRLCLSTVSRIVVPQGGAAHPGDAKTSAASSGVQPVPDGNSSGGAGAAGPNIEPMLSALGAAADRISAELREFQSR